MKAPFEPAPVTDPTLTPRVLRPQDIAYVETMRRQKAQEEAMQAMKTPPVQADTAPTDLLKVLNHLATIVTDNRTASDVSETPKFSGRTEDWDTWNQQFRTYLKAKEWLDTFLHPTGPGTPGFDQGINEKIYNKLKSYVGWATHLPTFSQQLSLTATEPVKNKNSSLAMMDFPSKGIQH
jgi:hypothetical protein